MLQRKMGSVTVGLMMVFAVASIGCGQGFKSAGAGESGALAIASANDAMAKAEEANQQALAAMSEADAALKSISDANGNINIGLFSKSSSSSVTSQGLLSPIIDKLRATFNTVFDKVALVKAKFTEARAKLNEALANLDASNPAQAALIAQIKSQLAGIDGLEAQFSAKMHSLASKLDIATTALDKLVSGVTSFIPGFGFIADMLLDYFVMDDVKAFLMEIKMKLMSL